MIPLIHSERMFYYIYSAECKQLIFENRQLILDYKNYPNQKAIPMTTTSYKPITRTERGLTISGTRITLYDIMDYANSQYPAKFISSLLNLTEAQINDALAYIETHRSEVDAEYQIVLQQAEASQQYWTEQNHKHSSPATITSKQDKEALWAKLQTQKLQHAQEACAKSK
jgi:uncharacterized protein (DUF433 family)